MKLNPYLKRHPAPNTTGPGQMYAPTIVYGIHDDWNLDPSYLSIFLSSYITRSSTIRTVIMEQIEYIYIWI